MAINEVYLLKVFAQFLGQQVLNTYGYQQTAGGTSNPAASLTSIFDAVVQSIVTGIAPDTMTFSRVEAFSIANPSDYSDRAPAFATGVRAILPANLQPSYVSFGLRSNRAGAGSRASYKRYAGMGDGDMDGNDLTAAFLGIPSVVSLPGILATTLVHATGDTFKPVQIKSGWTLGFAPVVNFLITSWAIPYLTSQVSRRS